MDAGPKSGLTASTCVAGAATARAASPSDAVIAAEVLGLISSSFIGSSQVMALVHIAYKSHRFGRPGTRVEPPRRRAMGLARCMQLARRQLARALRQAP
jgi:hypothetical protein